jgi:hypothetical protein
MLKNITLDLDFSHILATDHTHHSGSCIKHQVHELKDVHAQYSGFPLTYSLQNTLIHQLWWDDTQLDYIKIGRQLGIDVITISTICQPPGNIVPLHRDTFYQINLKCPDRTDLKVRANIYLEDWKLGHFIQYGDNVSTHWRAGQGFLWDSSMLHLSANAGMQNKYTMQVSGFLQQ